MDNSKQQNQSRLLLAALLSLMVFFGWSYFFGPKPTPNDNTSTAQTETNTAQTANLQQNSAAPEVRQSPQNQQNQVDIKEVATFSSDETPQKVVTIKSPLYEVKLDSKGAVATSWVLLKNVSPHNSNGRLLFADGSTEDNKKPLELISQEGLNRDSRELPFKLSTGSNPIDFIVNDRNYEISNYESGVFELDGQSSKVIEFVLQDEITWKETGLTEPIEVRKTFTFYADSYLTDLQVKLTKNGQTVPNTKLLVGPSIGDQGIHYHDYYRIEPEAVAHVNNEIERYAAYSFIEKSEDTTGKIVINGEVDWAGVGDTYFAMAAIPAQPTSGLEFRASKYEVEVEPFYDGIFAWITRSQTTKQTRHLVTAYVPVNTDGSTNKIYTGSKDYFTLSAYGDILSKSVGRTIDIEDLVNFSWYSPIRTVIKPLAIGLVWCLSFIDSFIGNYGVSIIVFTLIFYSIFFPIRWYQSKSFKKASANAPKMKEIQDRMKELQKKGVPMDDPRMREVQMEQLRMMKGALPIGGCLPLLLQMPLFIALYTAVTIAIDFRQASFLWLPDLSAADPWHILNFLFAGSMAGSMIFTPTAPVVTPEQQMQQKMMTYMMPALMLWLMWSVPAGLLLYWFFGNIVMFGQQFIINRFIKKDEPSEENKEEKVVPVSKKPKRKLSTS